MGQTPTYALPYPELADPADANKGFKDLANAVEAALTAQAIVPLGAILDWPYASGSIPTWALLPYGQLVGRVAYAGLHTLASAAGYPHGSGNGTTTFGLPDLRGRVLAGKDDMGGTAANRITAAISGTAGTILGATIGAEGATISTVQLPAHNHAITGNPSISGGITAGGTGVSLVGGGTGIGIYGAGTGVSVNGAGAHSHNIDVHKTGGSYGAVASAQFQGNMMVAPASGGVDASYAATAGDHGHGISDPTHAHSIYDPGHSHTVTDPTHGHGHTISAGVGGLTIGNGPGTGAQHANVQPLLVVNKFMRAL